jgi:anaerobic selenocysteine-containing dehydrogenase
MQQRIGRPYVIIHPAEAGRLGAAALSEVHVILAAQEFTATAHLDDTIPQGLALIPRSMGIPINAPSPVTIRAG